MRSSKGQEAMESKAALLRDGTFRYYLKASHAWVLVEYVTTMIHTQMTLGKILPQRLQLLMQMFFFLAFSLS